MFHSIYLIIGLKQEPWEDLYQRNGIFYGSIFDLFVLKTVMFH